MDWKDFEKSDKTYWDNGLIKTIDDEDVYRHDDNSMSYVGDKKVYYWDDGSIKSIE